MVALPHLNTAQVVDDLRVYLGGDGFDRARGELVVDLAMERADAIISPVPALARTIVLDVARRAYTNPSEVQSETVGPFSRTYASGAIGVYLTDREEAALRAIATGGTASGAFTIRPGGQRGARACDAAPRHR